MKLTRKLISRILIFILSTTFIYFSLIFFLEYLKPSSYRFDDIDLTKKDTSIQVWTTKWRLKILMKTKRAFIPDEIIDVKIQLTVIDPYLKQTLSHPRVIFPKSSNPEINDKAFFEKANYKNDGREKYIILFYPNQNGIDLVDNIDLTQTGIVYLNYTELGIYEGSGKIVYKAPGEYTYSLDLRGQKSANNPARTRIPVGSTTDLMNKRMSELVLILSLVSTFILIYVEFIKKSKNHPTNVKKKSND